MSSPRRGDDLLAFINSPLTRPEPGEDAGAARDRLRKRLMWQARRLSSISTLYAMATADHLRLNLSDMLCLGILSVAGPISPGQLAMLIGLSTGSVTGLIDRLERLDLVRRERDEQDRRRIVLHLTTDRAEEIGHAFIPMLEAAWQHLEQFSDDDLRVLLRYHEGAIGFMQEAIQEMRARDRAPVATPEPDAAEA
jgi:DNA-binding MarR family transcriptional regulator